MAHSEDMIPMQMAKELAEGHAADLRRLAAKPGPRRPNLRRFAGAWAAVRSTVAALRPRPAVLQHRPCPW